MLGEGWQPIATAPKRGRFIVRCGAWWSPDTGRDHRNRSAVMVERKGHRFKVADTCYYDAYIVKPTHWHPAPHPAP